jgi:hypothetical protein
MAGTITLTGLSESNGNNAPLINVNGGTLVMDGVTISGNKNSGNGGGVSVTNGGTFTMHSGKISGNEASIGGGVYVIDGTFTMHGGKISGNKASGNGGGVELWSGTFTMFDGEILGNTAMLGGGVLVNEGFFRIINGTIYGSDAATGIANTVTDVGAALSRLDGTAQFGTFSDSTGISGGDMGTTDVTIQVKNGLLDSIVFDPSDGNAFLFPEQHIWQYANLISETKVDWYSFPVVSGTIYYVWWNDAGQGDDGRSGDVEVIAMYSESGLYVIGSRNWVDNGWDPGQSFTASKNDTVYIGVRSSYFADDSNNTGTYGIVYSTSSTRPRE